MTTFLACIVSISFCLPLSSQAFLQPGFEASGMLAQGSGTSNSAAQQDSGSGNRRTRKKQPAQKQVGPKYDEYRRIIKEMRSVKAEIDFLFGSMPVGFPKLQAEQQEKINLLKKRQIVLSSQLEEAGIAAFQEASQTGSPFDQNVVNHVMRAMTGKIQPKSLDQRFDPKSGLELANLLTKAGFESPAVYFQAFRAAFAIQDFERAELMLAKIQEQGTNLPDSALQRLAKAKKNWQRELEIRRLEAAADDLPRARIETNAGTLDVELFENHAPIAVTNFINLAEKGFYDGQIFYLVRPGLVAETGCPNGNGKGNPGYRIPCECYGEEIRHHFIGSLSMVSGEKDTGGSKFFFTYQPNPTLDGKYTVFGRVTSSMDPLNNLGPQNKVKPSPDIAAQDTTKIIKVSILRKRNHEYEPTVLALNDAMKAAAAQDAAGTQAPAEEVRSIPRNPLLPSSGTMQPGETPAEGSGTTKETEALKAAKEALEGAREILGSDKK